MRTTQQTNQASLSADRQLVLFRRRTDASKLQPRASEMEKSVITERRATGATSDTSIIGQSWWQILLWRARNWISRRNRGFQLDESSVEAPIEHLEDGRQPDDEGLSEPRHHVVAISPRQHQRPGGLVSGSHRDSTVPYSRLPRQRSFERRRRVRPEWTD